MISLIRVGHDPARAVLETARERNCDLILLGWKGYTSTARRILGEVVDAVVTHARADVVLHHVRSHSQGQRLEEVRRPPSTRGVRTRVRGGMLSFAL